MHYLIFVLLLSGFVGDLWAKTALNQYEPKVSVILSLNQGAEMQLQVWQLPLPEILDKLSQVINTPIHYSVLPKGKVTATCVTSTVEELLKCLLGREANIAFRYPKEGIIADVPSHSPNEIWVLGSVLEAPESQDQCANNQSVNNSLSLPQEKGLENESVKLERLLQDAKVENPEQRALAIAKLATKGVLNSEKVTARLMQALNDPSVKVRMQALFGWVYREGAAAIPELMQALNDPEPAVRIKAVGLSNDEGLLNQAATDSNEAVRKYALMKLQAKQ